MPTRDDIYTAIRNADKAGDSESVQKLGAYLKTMPDDGASPPASAVQSSAPTKQAPDISNKIPQIGEVETGMNLGTGMIAAPVAGIRGLIQGATNLAGLTTTPAADVVRQTQEAMTYQPRTNVGKADTAAVAYPFQKLAEGADWAGRHVNDAVSAAGFPKTGAALGAAANVGVQSLPAIIGKGAGMLRGAEAAAPSAADEAAQAAARAKAYVAGNTGLDWGALGDEFKSRLTSIAADAGNLEKLDPKAVEREARLGELRIPATKGQVTRDLSQLTTEENLTKSKAGQPIRDVNSAQDERLHGLLDELRTQTGAQANTRQGVGSSVQGAERGKLAETKANAKAAYDLANKFGENERVDVDPLNAFLEDPINKANVGAQIGQRLEAYADTQGKVSLSNLEDIRQELTRDAKNPNKGGYYAGEAAKVIDGIMDQSGSSAYKNARAGWKAMKDEFDKQGRIKKLVSQKGMSTDRAAALEDTLDHVLKSPAEDIGKIKKSLLDTKGYSDKTAAAGKQAWRDIQGGVIEHLREKATGRRQIPGEKDAPQFNSSFLDTFKELDADGKIDQIFDKPAADQLRKIAKAVEDVRTKPSGRIAGSDTVPRALNIAEKLIDIKGLGTAVSIAKAIKNFGADERTARAATKGSPVGDAASAADRSIRYGQIGGALKKAAPAAPLTAGQVPYGVRNDTH